MDSMTTKTTTVTVTEITSDHIAVLVDTHTSGVPVFGLHIAACKWWTDRVAISVTNVHDAGGHIFVGGRPEVRGFSGYVAPLLDVIREHGRDWFDALMQPVTADFGGSPLTLSAPRDAGLRKHWNAAHPSHAAA